MEIQATIKYYKIKLLPDITVLEAVYIAELMYIKVEDNSYNFSDYENWEKIKRHFEEV